jgi:integrase/recombinase XerC
MANHQQYIDEFGQYLLLQKRYSTHTVRAYTDDLVQFSTFVQDTFDQIPLAEIKSSFVRSWLSYMRDEGLTAKSINRKISSLKTFYKYLLKNGIVKNTPLGQIVSPKISKRLPTYLEQQDTKTLLHHIDFEDGYKGILHRTIIATFYYTGMRLSELQQLQTNDLDFLQNSIKVLGKGNKERIIPMANELVLSLQQYMDERKKLQTDRTDLFVNENGEALYHKYIYNTVRKYLGQVTTQKKKSPHVLRHSFATHLTNNGAELNAVKELLGHASLAATQIYTHNSIEKLKEAHRKAHPKA